MSTNVSPDAFATGTKPAEVHIQPIAIATGTKPAEVRIQPTPIATGTKPAEICVAPILTVTGIKPPRIVANPLLLATVSEEGMSIRVECRADTLRSVTKGCRYPFDTLRALEIPVRLEADTARVLEFTLTLRSDTARCVEQSCELSFDAVRNLRGAQSFDTRRTVQKHLGVSFDTCRNVQGLSVISFATRRIVLGPLDVSSDTRRDVKRSLESSFDMRRIVEKHLDVPFDACRDVRGRFVISFDTCHIMMGHLDISSDTCRSVARRLDITADTSRTLQWRFDDPADTRRSVQRRSVIRFDACRVMFGPIDVSFSTRRDVRRRVDLSFGTRRSVQWHVEVSSDTCRLLIKRIVEGFAAVRLIPHNLGHVASSGIQSVTMTLAENTLSDSFQVVTTFPIYPKDTMRGWIMDFPFVFQAEEVREEGIRFTVKKTMYDADKMLYTPLTYSLSDLPTKSYRNLSGNTEKAVHASGHAGKIAAALGKQAAFICDDFVPRDNYADMETTYQSVLSGLFGWTKNVPRMQVNIFIREGRLFFLQRGHERDVVDLSNTPWFNHPTFDRKLMRTTWNQSAEATKTDGDLFTVVKSGNIYWIDGDDKTPEPRLDGVETDYETVNTGGGRSDSRIRFTERKNPDGTTTRADYEYIDTGTDYLLRQITEVTTFPSGEVYKTRITKYTYTPGGWRHMVVIENNEVVEESEESMGGGSSESGDSSVNTASAAWRARPGDRGNEHMEEQVRLSHGAKWKKAGSSAGNSFLPEVARDVPVLDYATYCAYMRELEWMDRKIEEKANLTITAPVCRGVVDPVGNHVMDFMDRYLLNGNEWLDHPFDFLSTPSIKGMHTRSCIIVSPRTRNFH